MTATASAIEFLGRGLYSPAEAARYVRLSPARVRRWVQGYRFQYRTRAGVRQGESGPVVRMDVPVREAIRVVSFLELVEILVVSAFLKRGVSMQAIRLARQHAARILNTPHPFAYRRFKTDGKGIFGDSPEFRGLLELVRNQYAFPQILTGYLEKVEFDDETLMAVRWWPMGRRSPVVIDPRIAFGAPTIAGTRITVSAIQDALRAGECSQSICFWLGVKPRDVRAARLFLGTNRAA